MRIQYLFNSSGEWIAFKIGPYVFDTNGDWIGWTPWNDDYVVTPEGEYLGTIWAGNRLFYFYDHEYRGYPGYPVYPDYPGYPGYPGDGGYFPLPSGATDVNISKYF